jgi:hypothetical protein
MDVGIRTRSSKIGIAMDKDKKRLIEQYIQLDPYRPTLDEAIVMPSAVKVWAVIGELSTAPRNRVAH